jgi:hypothetical protein
MDWLDPFLESKVVSLYREISSPKEKHNRWFIYGPEEEDYGYPQYELTAKSGHLQITQTAFDLRWGMQRPKPTNNGEWKDAAIRPSPILVRANYMQSHEKEVSHTIEGYTFSRPHLSKGFTFFSEDRHDFLVSIFFDGAMRTDRQSYDINPGGTLATDDDTFDYIPSGALGYFTWTPDDGTPKERVIAISGGYEETFAIDSVHHWISTLPDVQHDNVSLVADLFMEETHEVKDYEGSQVMEPGSVLLMRKLSSDGKLPGEWGKLQTKLDTRTKFDGNILNALRKMLGSPKEFFINMSDFTITKTIQSTTSATLLFAAHALTTPRGSQPRYTQKPKSKSTQRVTSTEKAGCF